MDTKKVFIFVNRGGLGDVVMVLGCLELFKNQYPDREITFSCSKDLTPLAFNNPYIKKVIPYREGIEKEYIVEGYKTFDLSDDVCLKYEFKHEPKVNKTRFELFCKALKVKTDNFIPKFILSEDEQEVGNHLLDFYKLNDSFKIGIISRTGSFSRIYPRFEELESLVPFNSKIMVFRGKAIDWSDMGWEKATIIENKPIREVAALLSKFHVIVGGDTGLMHLSASLGIPTIWLFSHIDARMRVKEYPEAQYIQGKCDDSPCWYNIKCEDLGQDKWIPCIRNIEPKEIIKLVNKVYDNTYKKELLCGD